jgi:hypothetical protein
MNSTENARIGERFKMLFDTLKLESDRGCVLVVSALVEETIENHILLYLLPKLDKNDDLMGRSGGQSITGFSAKINLAYRLGLIRADERAMYHQLRELRNVCAHHIDRQDFTANHFKDRTRNIIKQSSEIWESMLETVAPTLPLALTPTTVEEFVELLGWRSSFAMFFALVVAYKEASAIHITRLQPLNKMQV